MLFHVTHTHVWEACPYHDADRARETFGKMLGGFADTEARLVGAWVDAPAHRLFLVVEADSAPQVEEALAPVIDIGWAETAPVADAAEVVARRAEAS